MKKILWQLGTLVGAPVGIGLVAGIAVPAMIIGIPVWVGRKLHTRYSHLPQHKRNMVIAGGVTASVIVAPVVASCRRWYRCTDIIGVCLRRGTDIAVSQRWLRRIDD
ncbi:E3 ubiquitin-protein ligase RNF19A-like [Tubulanus polymorphus]|uniref:E3 ubiquitin-protein ligase RNF19A-like n=1 Tax=Tubulanus polymorphus TaxID=672921 RepID=UPI003DA227E4